MNLDRKLESHPYLPFLIILLFYGIKRVWDIVAIPEFTRLDFALVLLYTTRRLMFEAGELSRHMRETIISPTNALFIYPPGTYYLGLVCNTVAKLFQFELLAQALVPVLAYRLFRRALPAMLALLAALLSVHYSIVLLPLPDYTMQPFLLLSVWLLISGQLVAAGFFAGLVMILKHNIGLFLIITSLTYLFFRNIQPAARKPGDRSSLLVGLGGFFLFAAIFARRAIYLDEIAYFLLPYLCFWILVAAWAWRTPKLALDIRTYLRSGALFVALALILPLAVFLRFGAEVGYSNYLFSLFGMGFKFLKTWDLGIVHIIDSYVGFRESPLHHGFANLYYRIAVLVIFLSPFIANWAACRALWVSIRGKAKPAFESIRDTTSIASFSILGIFTLFPLEDYRIILSKVTLFAFAFFYVTRRTWNDSQRARSVLTALFGFTFLMTLPSIAKGVGNFRKPMSRGTPEMTELVGLPIDRDVAGELGRQVEVVKRSVGENSFYVVNFDSDEMVSLMSFFQHNLPQYYFQMRESMLDDASADAIISELQRRDYILVHTADYEKSRSGLLGPLDARIMAAVLQGYERADEYRNVTAGIPVSGIYDFLVFRKKSGAPGQD
ncbi:MAG: hypothetical protein ACXWPM_10735 [Bdellovibrionota bacterium]